MEHCVTSYIRSLTLDLLLTWIGLLSVTRKVHWWQSIQLPCSLVLQPYIQSNQNSHLWFINATFRSEYDGRCRQQSLASTPLQSADNWTCLVKRSCNQFGDRCFATAGTTLWNSLPEQLWQPDITFIQFKRSLKTFMFGSWAEAPCVWTLRALTRNLLTYLLTYLLAMTILMQCVNIYLMFVIVRFHILPGCRPECSVSDTTICTCGSGWTVHEHCWYVLYIKHILLVLYIKHILLVRWSANLLLWDEALFSYWCLENGIVGWHFINKLLYLTLMKEEKCFFCCKTISCSCDVHHDNGRCPPQICTIFLSRYCTRDGPNVRLWHSAEAEGLGRLTERVPNVRPNFGRMLCARMKQRLSLVSALSG